MITQSQKEQIRKMASAKYPVIGEDAIMQTEKHYAFREGAEAVLGQLDIDEEKMVDVMLLFLRAEIDYKEAKQQILNAITLKL